MTNRRRPYPRLRGVYHREDDRTPGDHRHRVLIRLDACDVEYAERVRRETGESRNSLVRRALRALGGYGEVE